MKLRKAVRWLASTFGATVLTPFLQAPATKLAEALHFDTTFSERWGPLMQWLSDLTQNVWYVFLAGAAVGFACGMWVDWLLRGEAGQSTGPNATAMAPRALVRLRFSGRNEPPDEVDKENIGTWFAYWSTETNFLIIDDKPAFTIPANWVIFLSFERPVQYKQIGVNFTGQRPELWQVRQHSSLSAVITIDSKMPECEMEIITRA